MDAIATAQESRLATETGYVTVSDGTQLHYSVTRPVGGGPIPALLEYNGYGPKPNGAFEKRFANAGYAYVTVHLRGSGCSEGIWELPSWRQAQDGYEVIEWIATREWSNGSVAMIGESYSAFIQSYVAALDPPHLVAVAPLNTVWDLYRDAFYPGGIYNHEAVALWAHGAQPGFSAAGAASYIAEGDSECVSHQALRPANNANSPVVQGQMHPFDDEFWQQRAPRAGVENLDVPLFTVMSWPDELLGSRGVHMLTELDALHIDFHAILTDGIHSMTPSSAVMNDLMAFMDHYVKGENNGYDLKPRIQVWWELSKNLEPTWTSEIGRWPAPEAQEKRFFLSEGGALSEAGPGSGGPAPYPYVPGTGQSRVGWSAGPGPSVAFTTPEFESDLVVLGSASADIWLASTAVDTDVQVTLSELRTDGKEILVQQGWLRASHRTLDHSKSTATMPYHTHAASDATNSFLTPGRPELLRVEIFPFGHAFRKGSRLRLRIEAPRAADVWWGFQALPVPATNFVYHDEDHQSALVLPVLPGVEAGATLPACSDLSRSLLINNQPCR